MSVDDDVTAWIEGLRHDDSIATKKLWEHYYQQLLQLAGRRLPNNMRREFDEEDVALSAIDSLCRGVAKGRFPDLSDRDCLWALLIVITKRKCRSRVRRHTAQKRGGGKVQGESAFNGELGGSIAEEIGKEPTPEFAAQMTEEVARLLDMLTDDVTRQLAILKMEGHTNKEAADRLSCSQTTIERRLRLIRKTWSQPENNE
jgi:RNA polymerase sigma factor (sigma-70 family)